MEFLRGSKTWCALTAVCGSLAALNGPETDAGCAKRVNDASSKFFRLFTLANKNSSISLNLGGVTELPKWFSHSLLSSGLSLLNVKKTIISSQWSQGRPRDRRAAKGPSVPSNSLLVSAEVSAVTAFIESNDVK